MYWICKTAGNIVKGILEQPLNNTRWRQWSCCNSCLIFCRGLAQIDAAVKLHVHRGSVILRCTDHLPRNCKQTFLSLLFQQQFSQHNSLQQANTQHQEEAGTAHKRFKGPYLQLNFSSTSPVEQLRKINCPKLKLMPRKAFFCLRPAIKALGLSLLQKLMPSWNKTTARSSQSAGAKQNLGGWECESWPGRGIIALHDNTDRQICFSTHLLERGENQRNRQWTRA